MVQGMDGLRFPLISEFFVRQSYLRLYYAQNIFFDLQNFFFYLEESTLITPCYGSIQTLQSISLKSLGDLRNPVYNLDFKGIYKDHCIQVEEIMGIQFQYDFLLMGIVKKITKWKNTLALKIIDFNNLIDSFVVFVNFKD